MSASTYNTAVIAPHRFAYGYFRQAWWNWLIGSAFFMGEVGGGLFLVSLVTGHGVGLLLGYLIVAVGKNTAHLLYLGRPERFWRAAMRPDRSWIARGIWATGVFMASGFVVLFPRLFEPYWVSNEAAKGWLGMLAGASAFIIMFYDGFVMKASRSIPFWHTTQLPVLCLSYAALGGTTLALTLRELHGEAIPEALVGVHYALLGVNVVLLGTYLYRMLHLHPAARESVRLLLRGAYAFAFLGLVVLVGWGGTLAFSLLHSWTQLTWMAIVIAACELTGDFALLMVLLRSGLFSPQAAPGQESCREARQ